MFEGGGEASGFGVLKKGLEGLLRRPTKKDHMLDFASRSVGQLLASTVLGSLACQVCRGLSPSRGLEH